MVAGIARLDRVALRGELAADGRFAVGVELTGAGLDLADAAGPVVGAVLGAAGLSVTADLALGVDTSRGLTARGSLGPVALPARSPSRLLEAVSARLVPGGDAPGLELLARSSGGLGSAVKALVDGFGLRVPIDPARVLDGGSPIGTPTAKAPESIGLAVRAGPVSGGGFLSVQPVDGGNRFSGALDLRLGPVAVTAFGVLTERADGWSLVLVLSVQFTPPIEVALGFTLNGVGGVVGVDVRVDTDVLRGQLRSGVLERLLFPPDPIAAAPTILSTLASVFPPSPGGFVVGPLLSLGWGRPVSFVRLDLAVVLALPDPTVLLLARLRVAVPAPEAPLIDLRAEVYGEFSARRVLVIASLVDSRIAAFDVSGDVGMLTRFGDDATFALSAGGFHPRFAAPPELADLRRVAVELSPPLGLTMRVEGYVAVTTNTVQLGGRVEVGYSIGVAGVHGYLALDALVTFDPFAFEVDIAAGVAVEVLGFSLVSIDLALHLSGPAPWRVHGTGRVNLPWPLPDPSISLGPIEWGEPRPVAGPTVSPAQLVARGAVGARGLDARRQPRPARAGDPARRRAGRGRGARRAVVAAARDADRRAARHAARPRRRRPRHPGRGPRAARRPDRRRGRRRALVGRRAAVPARAVRRPRRRRRPRRTGVRAARRGARRRPRRPQQRRRRRPAGRPHLRHELPRRAAARRRGSRRCSRRTTR